MMTNNTTSWKDQRKSVHKVNEELGLLIDDISPDDSYQLFCLQYPYGELITENSVLNVPAENTFVSLSNPNLNTRYLSELSYAPTPLILQLHNSAEVFFEKPSGIISLNTFAEGELYGLFEIMEPLTGCRGSSLWNVCSGSRSAFMLPKISDYVQHEQLKRHLNITAAQPQKPSDHALVFKEIAQQSMAGTGWHTKILAFGKKWFDAKNDSRAWLKFYNYLYKKSWQQSNVVRTYYEFNVLWEHIAPIIKYTQPNFYILSTFKNLINLGFGGQPGFQPTLQETQLLPGKVIEDAYVNVYGLKNYLPTIMVPNRLNHRNLKPVYYSFAEPMLLESNPDMRNKRNILAEQEHVFDLLSGFMKAITHKNEGYLYEQLKRITFDFFHTKYEVAGKISHAKQEIENDFTLNDKKNEYYPNRVYAASSHFLQGFVRLQKKIILNE